MRHCATATATEHRRSHSATGIVASLLRLGAGDVGGCTARVVLCHNRQFCPAHPVHGLELGRLV